MMFKLTGNLIIPLIVLTILIPVMINTEISLFDKEKIKIDRKINSKRLGNYLRKMMMKKNNLLENDLVFLENKDFSSLVSGDDINYSNMANPEDDYEFKSRVSALKWAKENFNSDNYKPYGISNDKEEINGWKIYLVLMIGNGGKHKLVKVCISNSIEDDFSIVTTYDKKCSFRIEKFNKYHIMKDLTIHDNKDLQDKKSNKVSKSKKTLSNTKQTNFTNQTVLQNNTIFEELEKYKKKYEELRKENEMKTENINRLKKQNQELSKLKEIMRRRALSNKAKTNPESFIEKNFETASLLMKTKNDFINDTPTKPRPKPVKFFSLDSLSQKFSIDELNKIKSLIKFAKTNQILEKIYEKNGDITLNDLLDKENMLFNSDKDNNYNIKNVLNSFFRNFTLNYQKEDSKLRNEILSLKKVENEQQLKLQGNFGQMGENVNMIKNLMMFVKELSGEFQKSMLVFGNTLGSLSKKIMNMTDNIETIQKKFNNLTKRVELFSGPNKQREFSFKQISGKIDHSIKNLTSSLASHNELMKIMIQNNTTHLLDEYQTKIKKEFKDTIETSNLSLKLALNIIRNISLNLTNFFDNKENNAHMNSINKLNHFIKSEKKVYQPQKKESFLRKKIIKLPKKSNMRIAPKATPPKKIETKVSVNEIGEKDSLEDEDSFDNIAPKQQKLAKKRIISNNYKDSFTDDFLDP